MSVYVVLEEKGWECLAVGQCTDDGEVVAIIDPQTLDPVANGFERAWRMVSPAMPSYWAAAAALKQRRIETFGAESQGSI